MKICGDCYFYQACEVEGCPKNKNPHGHCYAEAPVEIQWWVPVDDDKEELRDIACTSPREVYPDRRECRHWRDRDGDGGID